LTRRHPARHRRAANREGVRLVTLRRRLYEILEGDDTRDAITLVVRFVIIATIVLNVGFAIIETLPQFQTGEHALVFRSVEAVSFTIFALEYAVRIWVSIEDPRYADMPPLRARWRFVRSPSALIDLVAILPFLIARVFAVDLRTLALLRLLRIFKLLRYSTGITALFEAIYAERHTLISCLFVLLVAVITAATLLYITEGANQPGAFGSIPAAMWWAIVTLTTVGYGDVVPQTPLGRMIGALTMVTGLIVLALPIAIVATSFAEVIRRRGFVVNWATLARLPLFSGLSPAIIGEVLAVVRAQSFDAGNLILRRGEPATSLYITAAGTVEIEGLEGRENRPAGSAFGAFLTPEAERSVLLVRAITRVRLLMIPESDLAVLTGRWPALAARLAEAARRPEAMSSPTGAGTGETP
jgi:voltage-gated potassium channel